MQVSDDNHTIRNLRNIIAMKNLKYTINDSVSQLPVAFNTTYLQNTCDRPQAHSDKEKDIPPQEVAMFCCNAKLFTGSKPLA